MALTQVNAIGMMPARTCLMAQGDRCLVMDCRRELAAGEAVAALHGKAAWPTASGKGLLPTE